MKDILTKENDILNEDNIVISEPYLKGVLKEMLQGQSIVFHEKIYDKELLQERLYQLINKTCFKLAKKMWIQVKNAFNSNVSRSPFVFFNQNKQWFELSEGTNREDLQITFVDDKLVYQDNGTSNDVIINPIFFQEIYDSKMNSEDFIHHQSARKLEDYLLRKLKLD